MTQSRAALLAYVLVCGGLTATPAAAEVLRRFPAYVHGMILSGNGRFAVLTEDGGGTCGPPRLPSTSADVALHDLQTGRAECVSVNDAGVPGAPASSTSPSITADGELVVFESWATNLDSRCAGGVGHVYLRNRRTRHTECLSITEAGIPGQDRSWFPRISATGNLVVFHSSASNLVPDDANNAPDFFVVRVVDGARAGPIERIGAGPGSLNSTWGFSRPPVLSADGRFLAFSSFRSDLVPGDTNNTADVFRRDLVTGVTVRISVSASGVESDAFSDYPAISADGRFVAFFSGASTLIDGETTTRGQAYRRDLQTGEVLLVSRGRSGRGSDGGGVPYAISADGRFILFVSGGTDLVDGDTNSVSDVFSAKIEGRSIAFTKVSMATDGVTQADRDTTEVGMSADAGVISFVSPAVTLAPQTPTVGVWGFLARIPSGLSPVITGAGPGGGSHVRALDARGTADPAMNFYAYEPDFGGGASVASGDVDGDGAPDLVTGAGPGGGPHVRVFSAARHTTRAFGVPHEMASFYAYDPAFGGGISLAVGDVTGDGIAEIITGAGPGGGPHVRVFTVDTDWTTGTAGISEYTGFFAYAPGFAGGVRVATGDLDGDGVAEILTAAGPGGGPHVMAFSLSEARTAIPVVSFLAYHAAFGHGLSVAAGDLDGDGRDEIITGADAGGGPHVRAFSLDEGYSALREISSFYAYDAAFSGGVRVASGDADGDGRADIITAPGPGMSPWVRAFQGDTQGLVHEIAAFNAFSPTFGGGVFVAAPRR